MSFRIGHLPVEVQTHIFSCLRHADLATIMRVSKSFRRVTTPLLWTHIELHRSGWHEHFQYEDALNIDEDVRNGRSRNYIEFPPEEYLSFKDSVLGGYTKGWAELGLALNQSITSNNATLFSSGFATSQTDGLYPLVSIACVDFDRVDISNMTQAFEALPMCGLKASPNLCSP